MTRTESYLITDEYTNMTIYDYLKRELGLTAAQIRSLKFSPNMIQLNDTQARVTQRIKNGDCLKLTIHEKSSSHIEPGNALPEILYESDSVICIWKPAGIPTHPTGGHYFDSAENLLQNYYRLHGISCALRCIGRLDIDTEGILLFAKNKIAASRLWEQRNNGQFTKRYMAICEGVFSPEEFLYEQTIRLPLSKIQNHPIKMAVDPDGASAITHYKALKSWSTTSESGLVQTFTAIELRLETGRTHQIRIHMASIGHPLKGDPLYGTGIPNADRAHLSAYKIRFIDPSNRKPIEYTAEWSINITP